jgi:hypothetical protein
LRLSFLLRGIIPLCLILSSCQAPPVPPEVEKVKTQEHELWRTGAPLYAQQEYARYLDFLGAARDKLNREKAKIQWFRDYEKIRADFLVVLNQGENILETVRNEKETRSKDYSQRLSLLGGRITKIKALTESMNENGEIRKNLSQADVAYHEAGLLLKEEKYKELEPGLGRIDHHLRGAEEALFTLLARYADEGQVARWRKWAEETVRESKRRGNTAIVVNKLERTLTVFRSGRPAAVYEIGLGKCGLSDKLYAGDEATPEGRYKVIKKISGGRFAKALLIDYPNDDDRREYSQAKKKGLIPARAGIGGLIEIHGGGNDCLTNGCVAVRNEVIEDLFPTIPVGTPVTIVGSLESADRLLSSLGKS